MSEEKPDVIEELGKIENDNIRDYLRKRYLCREKMTNIEWGKLYNVTDESIRNWNKKHASLIERINALVDLELGESWNRIVSKTVKLLEDGLDMGSIPLAKEILPFIRPRKTDLEVSGELIHKHSPLTEAIEDLKSEMVSTTKDGIEGQNE